MGEIVKERNRTWQKAEANAVQTKNGGPFTTFLELNARPLGRGRYRIAWNSEARLAAGAVSIPKMRVVLNGDIIGIGCFQPASDEWDSRAGWDFARFAAAAEPVIEIQFRREGGGNTVQMRRLKLSIELMDEE